MATHRFNFTEAGKSLGDQLKDKLGVRTEGGKRVLKNVKDAGEIGLYVGVFVGTVAIVGAVGERLAKAIKGQSN